MSDHTQFLAGVRAAKDAMTPEQREAKEREDQERLVAKNLLPTWLTINDLHVIVTGANTGIGYETVRGIARLGKGQAHIILACRDVNKGNEAANKIREEHPEAHLEVMALDVSSIASVKQFVAEFRNKNSPLDILINNAGIMATPYKISSEKFEMQFVTNHLGHFALTQGLIDLIRPGGRVINLSSSAHYRMNGFSLQNLSHLEEKDYHPWLQYAFTKGCNVLFSNELDKRLKAQGKNITVAAVHPGFVRTDLQSRIGLDHDSFAAASGLTPLDPARGADCSLYAALCPGIPSGKYWDNCECRPAHPITNSNEFQVGLWELSEKLLAEL